MNERSQARARVVLCYEAPPRSFPFAAELTARIESLAQRSQVPLVHEADDPLLAHAAIIVVVAFSRPNVSLSSSRHSRIFELTLHTDSAGLLERQDISGPVPSPFGVADSVRLSPNASDPPTRVAHLADTAAALVDAAMGTSNAEAHPLLSLAPGDYTIRAAVSSTLAPGVGAALTRRVLSKLTHRLEALLNPDSPWETPGWSLPPVLASPLATRTTLSDPHHDTLAALAAAHHRTALAAADSLIAAVRRDSERALTTHGLGAVAPLTRALTRLATDLNTRRATLADLPPTQAAATNHALAAAEDAYALAQAGLSELPARLPTAAWRTTSHAPVFVALGALGLGPLLATQWPIPALAPYGGPWLLAGALTLGLVVLGSTTAAGFARLSRSSRESALQRAFEDRELARTNTAATSLSARESRLIRPALNRVAETIDELLAALAATAHAIETLSARTARAVPSSAPQSPHSPHSAQSAQSAHSNVHTLNAALLDALEPPVEPWLAAIQSELANHPTSPTLSDLEALVGATLSAVDWRTRRDLADLLAVPARDRLMALDAQVRHVVPSGEPALRIALLPTPLAPTRAETPDIFSDVTLAASRDDLHALVLAPTSPRRST